MSKKSKFKKFMKSNWMWFIIISILIIFIFFYKGNILNTIYNYNINDSTINQLNNATTNIDNSCKLSFNKYQACVGENATLTINDGQNAICNVYFKYNNNDWKYLITVNLNSMGYYSTTRAAEYAGLYRFAAICSSDKVCITNVVDINIINCSNDSSSDSEDENNQYIDCSLIYNPTSQTSCDIGLCNTGICKYYPSTITNPARCGCYVDSCSDSDNGIDIYTKGTCSDGTTTITDYCATTQYVGENWCENGVCIGASTLCPTGYQCYDGRCVKIQL